MAGTKKATELVAEDAPKSFEESLLELEKIVASMESGEMSLESSMHAYARGVELARVCQAQLQKAEQQVRVLEQDLLRPFNADDNGSSDNDLGEGRA